MPRPQALPDPVHEFTVSRSGRDTLHRNVATPGPTLSRPPMGTIVHLGILAGIWRDCGGGRSAFDGLSFARVILIGISFGSQVSAPKRL